MSADKSTIPVVEGSEPVYTDERAAGQEDKVAAESESTGKIPSSEVDALKDTIGGGETLDDETGVTTRGAKQDAYKQEKEVDGLDLGDSDANK